MTASRGPAYRITPDTSLVPLDPSDPEALSHPLLANLKYGTVLSSDSHFFLYRVSKALRLS